MKENIKEWLKTVSTAFISAAIIMQFVVPTNVYGGSMEPGFVHNDYLLVSRQAYAGKRAPQRGDVIVFKSELRDEKNRAKLLIKRVVGLPGDLLEICDGKVYINGEIIEENYTKEGFTNGQIGPLTVPEKKYFCMGDNRRRSQDSRDSAVGMIEEESIVGKVFFRIYPFGKFGKVGDDAE